MGKSLEDFKAELEKRDMPKITREEIKEYNSKPEVEGRGAKVVTISSDRFKNILIIILVGFLICAGTFTYLAYTDKLKLLNIDIPQCPEAPACPVAPACPTQPACPDCNVNCGNTNFTINPFPNNLTIRMTNST